MSCSVTGFLLQTVVGTDIADLLLREHRSVWLPGKSPNEANLIDFTNEPLERAEDEPGSGPLSLLSDTFMTVPENPGKETERFRELLLFGRKKVRPPLFPCPFLHLPLSLCRGSLAYGAFPVAYRNAREPVPGHFQHGFPLQSRQLSTDSSAARPKCCLCTIHIMIYCLLIS